MCFFAFLWTILFVIFLNFLGEIFQNFHSTWHPARYEFLTQKQSTGFVKADFSSFANLCLLPLWPYVPTGASRTDDDDCWEKKLVI